MTEPSKALWRCSCGHTAELPYGPPHRGPSCPNRYGSAHRSSSQVRLYFVEWIDDEGAS